MSEQHKRQPRFAICIKADVNDMLTVRKIYQVLPDPSVAESEFIRVIDDESEDYLYPAGSFVLIELPAEVQQALERVS